MKLNYIEILFTYIDFYQLAVNIFVLKFRPSCDTLFSEFSQSSTEVHSPIQGRQLQCNSVRRDGQTEKDGQLVRGRQEEERGPRNRKSNAKLNASSDAPNDFKSQRVITQTDARCVQSSLSPVQFGRQSEKEKTSQEGEEDMIESRHGEQCQCCA